MNWKPHTQNPQQMTTAIFARQSQDGGWHLCEGIRQWKPGDGWRYEMSGRAIGEKEFMWLDEADLLPTPGQAAQEGTGKAVYYWQDGYWITDKAEADLMDEINAFGSIHKTAWFPVDATPEEIKAQVRVLLANQ
jgi:hypothetical protein